MTPCVTSRNNNNYDAKDYRTNKEFEFHQKTGGINYVGSRQWCRSM